MRSEFEKIEWVKERLNHVWWSQGNEYCDTGKHPRANASFLNGALHLFREQHPKIDELQRINQMLNDNIKEQDQKLVYQNEVVEKQAVKLLRLRDEKNELQKRVDASLIVFEKLKEEINQLHGQCDLHLIKYLEEKSQVLEQALKGEQQ
ncbi:hypothetical protein [Acinetobacter junii]|uniref:hypothetical protein n=1 Tax=Acinetobacter junii TaxID=40215 RepID=UPI00301B236C